MEDKEYNKTNFEYSVGGYNPDWPHRFELLKQKLAQVFGNKALRIEHIGSTAVPGLSAKPTIDVLIEVNSIEDLSSETKAMEDMGLTRSNNYIAPNSVLFMDRSGKERAEIIHVFPQNHPNISGMLVLRDFLRAHPEEVNEYENIKLRLTEQFPDDYINYRKGKDEYVERMLQKAREWEMV